MARHSVSLGATEDQVSLLATSYAITAIVVRLFVSHLNDRGFSTILMIAGGLLSAASFLIFSIADNVTQLYVGRLVQGVSVALYIPASLYSASVGDVERATRVILWRSTMWGVGSTIGPAVMGLAIQNSSWTTMYYLGAAVSLASALLCLAVEAPRGETGGRRSSKSSVLTRPFLLSSLALLLYVVAYQSLFVFLPALHEKEDYPSSGTSLAFTVLAAFNLASRLILSLTSLLQPPSAALLGALLGFGGYVAIALWPMGFLSLLGSALVGFGLGLLVPSLQVISLLGVPQDRRGLASSVYTAMFDIASLIGPPLVMSLSGTYERSLFVSAIYALLSSLPVIVIYNGKREKVEGR
ncbi:MAG: MFS transporter [Acidilobaceae archaeon]|nr:MFS transporter [Acidilobaceae archaeon]MCX8165615.1 MFS transporter [Acidilobaceae archaeon]MDW7974042.1 MFS transporter [Sulfolobales archaeon]